MTGRLEALDRLSGDERRTVLSFWDQNARTLFQERLWTDIIRECYGHRTHLFLADDDGRITGLLPLIKIRNKYISLPFIDYTAPVCALGREQEVLDCLNEYLPAGPLRIHLRYREKYILPDLRADTGNVTLRLALDASEKQTWKKFTAKVRNQVRKPEKNGITVKAGDEALTEFYRIWAVHISRLGTPVHSLGLFKALFKALPENRRYLITAWKDGEPVGGLILLFDKETAYVPWAASRHEYRSLCINHALYWYAIGLSIRSGKKEFDFLRSQPGSGTFNFKRQWGAVETPLFYYDSGGSGSPKGGTGFKLASEVWRRLPLAVSLRLGPLVRKYIA